MVNFLAGPKPYIGALIGYKMNFLLARNHAKNLGLTAWQDALEKEAQETEDAFEACALIYSLVGQGICPKEQNKQHLHLDEIKEMAALDATLKKCEDNRERTVAILHTIHGHKYQSLSVQFACTRLIQVMRDEEQAEGKTIGWEEKDHLADIVKKNIAQTPLIKNFAKNSGFWDQTHSAPLPVENVKNKPGVLSFLKGLFNDNNLNDIEKSGLEFVSNSTNYRLKN